MAEVSRYTKLSWHVNVSNVFHDVNSILYTENQRSPKGWVLLKLSMFFLVKTSQHSQKPKNYKKTNSETKWKVTEDLPSPLLDGRIIICFIF